MAEFLLRVKDKKNPVVLEGALYHDVKLLQRGHVVVVCPDGHPWSMLEKTNPDWRIVAAPGISLEEARTYLTPEVGDEATNKVLQRRAFKLNLDAPALPKAIRDWIADDSRAQPILTFPAGGLRGIKTAVAPINDPLVIR